MGGEKEETTVSKSSSAAKVADRTSTELVGIHFASTVIHVYRLAVCKQATLSELIELYRSVLPSFHDYVTDPRYRFSILSKM